MAFPRSYHNLTLLPDGTVLASGGSSISDGVDLTKAVLPAEIWNPTTETWTDGRLSHERTRVPLDGAAPSGRACADGRRRSAAGLERRQPDQRGDLLAPVPLQGRAADDQRPRRGRSQYGSTFTVTTPDAASIASVVADPHAVGHALRSTRTSASSSAQLHAGSGQLTVGTRRRRNLAPPGYYMLFLVNGNGVPSVATFVRFPAPWEDTVAADRARRADRDAGVERDGVTRLDGLRRTTSASRATTSTARPRRASRRRSRTGSRSPRARPTPTRASATAPTTTACGRRTLPATSARRSNEASATVAAVDTTAPTVSITAPSAGATVSANDHDHRERVRQRRCRGRAVPGSTGRTSAPRTRALRTPSTWDTIPLANGQHTLTAVARDAAGNQTTSTAVTRERPERRRTAAPPGRRLDARAGCRLQLRRHRRGVPDHGHEQRHAVEGEHLPRRHVDGHQRRRGVYTTATTTRARCCPRARSMTRWSAAWNDVAMSRRTITSGHDLLDRASSADRERHRSFP